MGKLKIVNEEGEIVYEFSESGYFGVIDNSFLVEIAGGQLDKSEIKAACYLMSTATWSNKIDHEITKGAKLVGITYKAYSEVFRRLVEKKILIEDAGAYYFNPEKFRRRTIKKKFEYKPWNTQNSIKKNWDDLDKKEETEPQ